MSDRLLDLFTSRPCSSEALAPVNGQSIPAFRHIINTHFEVWVDVSIGIAASRLRKTIFYAAELRWPARLGQQENTSGMLKKTVQQGRSERRGEAYASVR
jgi:hypothetical protein